MAQTPGVMPATEVAAMFQLDLKNRPLAALLAWLVPGAGHLYQGRTAKGLLLMICITTTFAFGFYLGGCKVAYATPLTIQQITAQDPGASFLGSRFTQALDRWPFLCQAGIGTIAIPAVVERQRFLTNKGPLLGGWFRPPRQTGDGLQPTRLSTNKNVKHPNELAQWNYEYGFRFELGTIYTVIAGLLNVLAIYDAYSGPLIHAPARKEDDTGSDKSPSGEKTKKA